MKKFTLLAILALGLPDLAGAADIATCRNPSGFAYYHYQALVPIEKSGWTKDAITGGVTQIVKNADGKYDILILDATKNIISLRQDGGEVILVSKSLSHATFVHISGATEIYSVYRENNGKVKFDLLQSKNNEFLGKGAAMTGDCDFFNFNAL